MREVGWQPARIWPDHIRDRLAIKVASADRSHPFAAAGTTRFRWLRDRVNVSLSSWRPQPPWELLNWARLKQDIAAAGCAAGIASSDDCSQ